MPFEVLQERQRLNQMTETERQAEQEVRSNYAYDAAPQLRFFIFPLYTFPFVFLTVLFINQWKYYVFLGCFLTFIYIMERRGYTLRTLFWFVRAKISGRIVKRVPNINGYRIR